MHDFYMVYRGQINAAIYIIIAAITVGIALAYMEDIDDPAIPVFTGILWPFAIPLVILCLIVYKSYLIAKKFKNGKKSSSS